ncbi:proteasome subunit alpha [Gordonia amarae]|mgnify:FL=1|uniref:Proteasome subunit alpha n=2 Tax=Gordonia amarae TaxID=36821 RepID=G7GJI7_9ACTN|nr:proteasome subunit alpha [Gordonia amarae]MCS3879066.1 proteasome alpha subunit [Gordonia amarae]QHN17600.1 proteasome subunit alpha [Gordonia amarae]QHN22126.1 proteasome subunit alpha [Gordonia amarae]QHN31007.1 proteasome subunit alpha [Gordonia amarae]QHN39753.1 proteasome subunit alpha [Gordonia amarae]
MTFPYYASAEQIMRDRSELARKGIARGRSVVALTYADGVLFVAENPSNTLRKVSEIYDRIGFAAVGKYNEFESLRKAGIQLADMRGYSYDRADVSGLSLANAYANTLGAVFTEQPKPFEVELCVAEVAKPGKPGVSQLYRISYDGSISDETRFLVMGGATEAIAATLREKYESGLSLADALTLAVDALATPPPAANGAAEAPRRELTAGDLEVAILDHNRPRRAFRRLPAKTVEELLAQVASASGEPEQAKTDVPPTTEDQPE